MKGTCYSRLPGHCAANATSIALILVGGFGTRLRPLVLFPAENNLMPAPVLIILVKLDPDAPQTPGRVRKPAYDPAPSRELGCCRCDRYCVGCQLPSGCYGLDPQEGALSILCVLTTSMR